MVCKMIVTNTYLSSQINTLCKAACGSNPPPTKAIKLQRNSISMPPIPPFNDRSTDNLYCGCRLWTLNPLAVPIAKHPPSWLNSAVNSWLRFDGWWKWSTKLLSSVVVVVVVPVQLLLLLLLLLSLLLLVPRQLPPPILSPFAESDSISESWSFMMMILRLLIINYRYCYWTN